MLFYRLVLIDLDGVFTLISQLSNLSIHEFVSFWNASCLWWKNPGFLLDCPVWLLIDCIKFWLRWNHFHFWGIFAISEKNINIKNQYFTKIIHWSGYLDTELSDAAPTDERPNLSPDEWSFSAARFLAIITLDTSDGYNVFCMVLKNTLKVKM